VAHTAGDKALTVLIAPDSFKGSLTSVEVARALAGGWWKARPDDEVLNAPLGDGGEGTIYAIAYASGWEWLVARIDDLEHIDELGAKWLRSDDGERAYVELAQASGLSLPLVGPRERDPVTVETHGTGQVLRAVLDAGVRRITLGIGGSATTDGGRGMLRELGLVDKGGRVDLAGLDPRLADVEMQVACDVNNPLLGPSGAAATYGPQKGATPVQVAELDARNAAWADRLEAATGRHERNTPGAGAAGGVGFGLLAVQDRFGSFGLRPGIDLVMEATDFDAKLARADVVITGEGRIDAQTAFGKTALGVAKRAAEAAVPCVAVGGGVEPEGIDVLAAVGAVAVPVAERPQSVDQAMAAGWEPVARCGERMARLIGMLR
jgi:glycerate kinase